MTHTKNNGGVSKTMMGGVATGILVGAIVMMTGVNGRDVKASMPLIPAVTRVAVAATPVNLSDAMEQRTKLLERSVSVKLTAGSGEVVATWALVLRDYPSWVVFTVDGSGNSRAVVDPQRIRQYLISYPIQNIPLPKSCAVMSEWTDGQGVLRAQTGCIAQSGYVYDVEGVALVAKKALETGESVAEYRLQTVAATIDGSGTAGAAVTGQLTLLATGKSNFKGSGAGRKANVRKALNERVNNVIVPVGATFSFNSTLGDAVSVSRGWQLALTIFEGVNLRAAPGGGICQASTTTYRAALQAGFPIIQHKSHSLYVTYYEQYGVGQDATVFPGLQDLTFVNDSPGPLLIQSYNKGDDAFVHIYGVEDHRTVKISGPYFADNAPADLSPGHTLQRNEIAWRRYVLMPDGTAKQEVFVAHYTAIPRSLPKRMPLTVTQSRGARQMTASVETVADLR